MACRSVWPDWPSARSRQTSSKLLPVAASIPLICARCASLSKIPGSRLLMVTLRATVWRASPRDEADEAGACAVRQAELVLRNLHAARDDIDDAAEAARHHAVDGEPHHLDRRQHHRVERGDPVVPRPVAEIAGQRAVCVVEQDIRLGAGRKRGRASLLVVMSPATAVTLTPVAAAISAPVRSSTSRRARDDGHVDAFAARARRRRPCRDLCSRRSAAPFCRGCRGPLFERVLDALRRRRPRSDRPCSRTSCRGRAPGRCGCLWRAPRRRGWSAACADRRPAGRAPSSAI